MTKRVTLNIENCIAEVSLNRPQKFNALDSETFDELISAAESIANHGQVRAVVLYGIGENFCAGLDLNILRNGQLDAFAGELLSLHGDSAANRLQRAALIWRELPMPVIASLRGVTFGGGLQLALGADIRLASPDTRLSVMEVKWGLIPDMGITETLPDQLALDVAKELLWTGRIVEAEEELALGLITRICVEPLQGARALAEEIAGKSPEVIRRAKQLLSTSWRDEAAASLRREAELQLELIGSEHQKEATQANLERREPLFR